MWQTIRIKAEIMRIRLGVYADAKLRELFSMLYERFSPQGHPRSQTHSRYFCIVPVAMLMFLKSKNLCGITRLTGN